MGSVDRNEQSCADKQSSDDLSGTVTSTLLCSSWTACAISASYYQLSDVSVTFCQTHKKWLKVSSSREEWKPHFLDTEEPNTWPYAVAENDSKMRNVQNIVIAVAFMPPVEYTGETYRCVRCQNGRQRRTKRINLKWSLQSLTDILSMVIFCKIKDLFINTCWTLVEENHWYSVCWKHFFLLC